MLTAKIDWLSLSAKYPLGLNPTDISFDDGVRLIQRTFGGPHLASTEARLTRGRGAARWGITWETAGLTLFAGDDSGWIAVEFSGRGCDWLRQSGKLETALYADGWRQTRLDVAIDLAGDVMPSDLDATVDKTRFKTRSQITSAQGDTFYYGSPASARMLRIYRYAPPHPRADKTRLEFVCRDKAARNLAGALRKASIGACAAELVRKFAVTHPALSDLGDSVKLSGYDDSERQSPGRFKWVASQAIPGIARAIKDGITTETEVIAALRRALESG